MLEEKLFAIKGDITLAKFGISECDMKLLAKDVSIVFNSAATIRFVEPIDVAVRNNIYSVSQLVEFCNGLEALQALIHLSTAYSNCHKRDTIYEIFYKPPMRGEQILSALQSLKQVQSEIQVYPRKKPTSEDDEEDLNQNKLERSACEHQIFYRDDKTNSDDKLEQSELLEEFSKVALRKSNRPNTYTFTKAIAESYLLDLVKKFPERYLGDKIPVCIVRPSIVGGAWREPAVGFVDNYNGPTGAILSLYMGALQAMPGKGDRVADLVPVDMVVNMITCVGWFLVGQREAKEASLSEQQVSKQTRVKTDQGAYIFNFVSGFRNPLQWQTVTELIASIAYKYPTKMLMRLPSSYFIRPGKFYNLYDKLNHKLPAQVSDFVAQSLLRKELNSRSSALVSYSRIRQMTETLTPFTSNQWRLSDANVCALYDCLSSSDKQVFEFNVAMINWQHYIRNYIFGARIYTLKDEPANIPEAMQSLRM